MADAAKTFLFGRYRLIPDRRALFADGDEVSMGGRAFDLLLTLVERRDRVVLKNELIELVWPGRVVEEGNLTVHVASLRKRFGKGIIKTLPGRGYRFVAPVQEVVSTENAQSGAQQDSAGLRSLKPAPSAASDTASPPHTVPRPLTRLVGRADDLDRVEAFVLKHNKRNPEREVLYLNYSANDPVLTNEKCHFWHFRFDANTDIKMAALTNYVKAQPAIKKVYLLNQDYSFGQSFRAQARTMLAEKRPDIEIVGDELHPFLKVTDFSPYAAKIKASGADTILTGNWGQDLALLLKAAAEAGLQANWYTYYAGGIGAPTAIRQANLPDRVFEIIEEIPNSAPAEFQAYETDFRAKNGGMSIWLPRVVNQLRMLAKAISEAKSENVRKVAEKLEGMKFPGVSGGEVWMRKEDHQAFQPIYVGSFGPLEAGEKFDEEGTGWGWRQVGAVDGKDTVLPTICKMERP